MNLVLLFRFKKAENQYMSHKKYGVHLGLSGSFDLVCLQYSSSVRKTHSLSARASSPTTRTANSTLGLKWPTSRPRYTIYYYISTINISRIVEYPRSFQLTIWSPGHSLYSSFAAEISRQVCADSKLTVNNSRWCKNFFLSLYISKLFLKFSSNLYKPMYY